MITAPREIGYPRLIIKGEGQAELVYDSLKGGYKTKSVVLQ
jgi:hypothetical protein